MSAPDYTYERIEEAIRYLEQNFQRQPELGEVADHVNLSPHHFQRLFSAWAGISPKRFLQYLTVNFLKTRLRETRNLTEAAEVAGLSAQSRVYDLFTTLEAMTPQEYKEHGAGLNIIYGYHDTPFGPAHLGITTRGICWLSYNPDPDAALIAMQSHWYLATTTRDDAATQPYVDRIFHQGNFTSGEKLHVLVKGTNFQIRVWEALLRLPTGTVTTYQTIAEQIDQPRALQAVGSAVGANHIAYLIPCHRVIRKDGILGEYAWGPVRKKSMIGWEMARVVG